MTQKTAPTRLVVRATWCSMSLHAEWEVYMRRALLRTTIREILSRFGVDAEKLEAISLALEDALGPYSFGENPAFRDQLQKLQKMEALGELTSGIAKDFKNLGTIISSNAELALEVLEPGHPARRNLEEILEAGTGTRELVEGVLAFSRQRARTQAVVHVGERLEVMDALLRRFIPEHIEIVTRRPADLPAVPMDPAQFEQVLLSLVVNARDAMPEGGRLTIEAELIHLEPNETRLGPGRPGDYVCVSVHDTGAGVAPDVKDRIFEPFFTTKSTAGTGLGLATVRGIVEDAGGRVAMSSPPGRGTTFRIYLPVTSVPATTPPASQGGPTPPTGDETILVVEDEPAVRKVTVALLEKLGYRVFQAANGEDALSRARGIPDLDLLLTDMVMPVMSGAELIRHFRRNRPAVHLLCMSGYAGSRDELERTTEEGVVFLQKPFSLDRLATAVRQAIAQSTASTESGSF